MQNISPLSFLPNEAVWVEEAQISSHISALVDPEIRRSISDGHSVKIYVIGYDLPNLTNEAYEGWRSLLADWKKSGVEMQYIALDDSTDIKSSLDLNIHLLEQFRNDSGTGGVEIFTPKSQTDLDRDSFMVLRWLRKEHRTSHFLLAVDTTDEKRSTMWLEGNHEPGSTKATDCWFFGEGSASENPIFVQHRINFEFLKSVSNKIF